AVAQEHGNVAAAVVDYHQVEVAVLVEVRRLQIERVESDVKPHRVAVAVESHRVEGAIAVAQKDDDAARTRAKVGDSDGQVGLAVVIEVRADDVVGDQERGVGVEGEE